MKRNFFVKAVLLAVIVSAGLAVFNANYATKKLSNLELANIEALTDDNESGSAIIWDCYSNLTQGYGCYACGVPCVWYEDRNGLGPTSDCIRM